MKFFGAGRMATMTKGKGRRLGHHVKELSECFAAGMTELPYARATFVKVNNGATISVCTLHVDDGLLAGHPKRPEFQRLKSSIDQNLSIKEWKLFGAEAIDFLACKISLRDGALKDCMKLYVEKIDPMIVDKSDNLLNDTQKTAF